MVKTHRSRHLRLRELGCGLAARCGWCCRRYRWLDDDFVGSGVASLGNGDGCLGWGRDGCGSRSVTFFFLERQSNLGSILQQANALVKFHVFARDNRGCDEKFVFVRNLQPAFFQRGLGLDECVRCFLEWVAVERRHLEFFCCNLDHIRIGRERRSTKVAEN